MAAIANMNSFAAEAIPDETLSRAIALNYGGVDAGLEGGTLPVSIPDSLLQALRQRAQQPETQLADLLSTRLGDNWAATLPPHCRWHLNWMDEVFRHWRLVAPLSAELGRDFVRLHPLALALSFSDPDFLEPGKHPLHKAIDALFEASIGWDSSLEHSDDQLRRLVRDAVDALLRAFAEQRGDHGTICDHVSRAAHSFIERRQRALTRLMEAERSQLRTAGVRNVAAQSVNELLRRYTAPALLGEFIKGPWYESLQLCLLRHGSSSNDWQQRIALTERLLAHVQAASALDEHAPQDDASERIPEELRNALHSTGSDEQVIGEAISPVEFSLLRIQLQNPLPLEVLAPISIAGEHAETEISAHMLESVTALKEGDWLLLSSEPGAPRTRAVIVAKLDEEQEVLLGNQLGMKISTQSFTQLAYMLSTGRATTLPARHCFSDALRHAAFAAPADVLEAERLLTSAAHESTEQPTVPTADHIEAESQTSESEETAAPALGAALHDEAEHGERSGGDAAEPAGDSTEERVGDDAPEPAGDSTEEYVGDDAPETAGDSTPDAAGNDAVEPVPDDAVEPAGSTALVTATKEAEAPPTGRLESADGPAAPGGSVPSTQRSPRDGGPLFGRRGDKPAAALLGEDSLPIAMGSWLGFHDGEIATLGKLAVHDRERDLFMFVNRAGLKLRECNRAELDSLYAAGELELLQVKSDFKAVVGRIQKYLQQISEPDAS